MKNNVIGKIPLDSAKKKRSRFNLSHDVNTTFEFGMVQPLMARLLVPGSKTELDVDSLVRLSPLVAPAFARMKYKLWNAFVPCSDIWENFDSFLAQTPISRTSGTAVPKEVPSVELGWLSFLCLSGAKMTLYVGSTALDSPETNNVTGYKCKVGSKPNANLISAVNDLVASKILKKGIDYPYGYPSSQLTVTSSWSFVFSRVWSKSDWSFEEGFGTSAPYLCSVPLSNYTGSSGENQDCIDFGITDLDDGSPNSQYQPPVALDSADIVIPVKTSASCYFCAFRLSNFGARLRKVLIGLGYQINVYSTEKVSLLPLFALFKAYFDVFGLVQYTNYNQTAAWRFMNALTQQASYNYDSFAAILVSQPVMARNFLAFFYQLANLWYTDEQDYVSAHVRNTAISPSLGISGNFVDVAGKAGITEVDSSSQASGVNDGTSGNHSFINQLQHGELDSEYLKRLYKWTNRNTVIGQEIDKLLRAQGLGDWCDSCKSTFIGYSESPIFVEQVTAVSDTYDAATENGTVLGDYAGKSVRECQTKHLSYENSEYGYWITLAAFVPQAGYSQGIDPMLLTQTKADFYNPEFDGLGYEMSPRSVVVGNVNFGDANDTTNVGQNAQSGFGLIPRYSGFKVAQSKLNGEFSLRGVRDRFLPYTLDKVIDVGERESRVFNDSDGATVYVLFRQFDSKDFPIASPNWRYPTRYPWLGNFNRIFVNTGKYQIPQHDGWRSDAGLVFFEFFARNYDNVLVHNVLNLQQYAPMLPIADSFETQDDEGNSQTVLVEKA